MSAHDGGAYGAVGGVLFTVAALATAIPAWRATRVDVRHAMAAE
jgi:ABC-type lipoprotein release transport system permease subunit